MNLSHTLDIQPSSMGVNANTPVVLSYTITVPNVTTVKATYTTGSNLSFAGGSKTNSQNDNIPTGTHTIARNVDLVANSAGLHAITLVVQEIGTANGGNARGAILAMAVINSHNFAFLNNSSVDLQTFNNLVDNNNQPIVLSKYSIHKLLKHRNFKYNKSNKKWEKL